jgi:hypothetical protein
MSTAFIQGNSTVGGTGLTSETCAFSSNNTAGSMLFCVVRYSPTGSTFSSWTCSDNNGNTWVPVGTPYDTFGGTTGDKYQAFYALNVNAGANTVKIQLNGGGVNGYLRMSIGEWGPGVTAFDQAGNWMKVASSATGYTMGVNSPNTNLLQLLAGGQNTTVTSISAVGGGFTNRVVDSPADALICDFTGGPTASTGLASVTFANSTTTYLQIVSFKTSSSATANLWTKRGMAFLPNSSDYATIGDNGTEAPNVIYEGNPQILTSQSQVYKMWFQGGNNTGYAESTDGINWTRKSTNVLTNAILFPRVVKSGSTYYISGPRASTYPWTAIDIYSSTDGINWSIYQSGTVTVDGGFSSFTHGMIWIEGGTWYMFYDELGSTTYQICLATSSDGHTWAKYGSNPILTQFNPSGPYVQKVGSTYYLWAESWLNLGIAGVNRGTADIYRWHSSSLYGPWTLDGCTFPRTDADEGPDSIGDSGQTSDVCMVTVGNQTLLYYVPVPMQASQTQLNAFIKIASTPNTLAQIVSGAEGVATDTIAVPTSTSAQYVQSNSYYSTSTSGPNSPTLAYNSPNTAGNFLLLLARITDGTNTSIPITGVVDTAGNTWQYGFHLIGIGNENPASTNVDNLVGFFVPKCAGGANTVHITSTDGTNPYWTYAIFEYSGLGSSPTILGASWSAGVASLSGTSGVVGNLHTQMPNTVLAGFFGNPTTNGLTFTPGSGWTSRQSMNGNSVAVDGLAATAGVYQATMGFSSSIPWGGVIVALGTLSLTNLTLATPTSGNLYVLGALYQLGQI